MSGEHLVVDGMNVIGSRPDGWWRDRTGAACRLVERLQHLADVDDLEVTLVLDGRPSARLGEGGHGRVLVVFARRAGRDAGDDRLVELLEVTTAADGVCVVTSDRGLAERARALGFTVTGAGALLDRLDRA